MGNVHQVVRSQVPDARIAYVDIDGAAVAHTRELLEHDPTGAGVTVTPPICARSSRFQTVAGLLDFTRPIALLAVAVLHFVPDVDDPARVLSRYLSAMTADSILVLSDASDNHDDPKLAAAMCVGAAVYARSVTAAYPRDRSSIYRLLRGTRVLEPGLVDVLHSGPPSRSPLSRHPAAPTARSLKSDGNDAGRGVEAHVGQAHLWGRADIETASRRTTSTPASRRS